MECLGRTAAPSGPSLAAGGTGSPAQEEVAAYGALSGDSSSHQRGLTSRGDGESRSSGGRCLWNASGAWQPPAAQAHYLEDGESCPGDGHCLWSAVGGWQPPSAPARKLEGWGYGMVWYALQSRGAASLALHVPRSGPGVGAAAGMETRLAGPPRGGGELLAGRSPTPCPPFPLPLALPSLVPLTRGHRGSSREARCPGRHTLQATVQGPAPQAASTLPAPASCASNQMLHGSVRHRAIPKSMEGFRPA